MFASLLAANHVFDKYNGSEIKSVTHRSNRSHLGSSSSFLWWRQGEEIRSANQAILDAKKAIEAAEKNVVTQKASLRKDMKSSEKDRRLRGALQAIISAKAKLKRAEKAKDVTMNRIELGNTRVSGSYKC